MSSRIRHCVECPKCRTRYLIGFSPYPNGSNLVTFGTGPREEGALYCSCCRPPIQIRWNRSQLKPYAVSNGAYARGYGPPEEIVPVECDGGAPVYRSVDR